MGRRLYFDLETDGLLGNVTYTPEGEKVYAPGSVSRVWCCEVMDLDTRETFSFSSEHRRYPGYGPLDQCMKLLEGADLLVGHNILTYDCDVVRKLYPWWNFKGTIIDTLVLSRLIFPEIKTQVDFGLIRSNKAVPGAWMGKHSLESWGIRLNRPKDDYSARCKERGIDPWGQWSEEMQSYCKQDVVTGVAIYEKLTSKEPDPRSVELEHAFRYIIHLQEENGFWFNVKAAQALYVQLAARRAELESQLKARFGYWYVPEKWASEELGLAFTPKVNGGPMRYTKGAPCTKVKLVEFNPGSREQIATVLKKHYGWEPTAFSEKTGEPTVSESVLEALQYPEAKLLNEYLLHQKLLGMMSEGDKSWFKFETNGRIHGAVNTNGAVTGRCSHFNPNIAQVPKVGSPFGKECRGLFGPPPGWTMLGCDASGLELRMLAHFMAAYDKGKYAKVLLEGDIHSVNASALFGFQLEQFLAGRKDERILIDCANEHPGSGKYLRSLPPGRSKEALVKEFYGFLRDSTKTFIYAFLYGAGPVKIGSIVEPLAHEQEQRKLGLQLTSSFLNKTPALKKLRDAVKKAVKEKGFLKGIDGRKLPIRSDHSALNTLFQSAGAVSVKKATVILHAKMAAAGFVYGRDWLQLAHVHDEFQLALRPGVDVELVGSLAVASIQEAGIYFNFRLPLDGEFKVGANWAETH